MAGRKAVEKLIAILMAAKPVMDAEQLKSANDLYGEGVIDSFDIIVILDEINAAFGVEIGGAGFTRDDFMTPESIYGLVKRHGGA
jgi:acyl carrier protein